MAAAHGGTDVSGRSVNGALWGGAAESTARRRGAPRQAASEKKLLSLWRLRARPLRALLGTQSAAQTGA